MVSGQSMTASMVLDPSRPPFPHVRNGSITVLNALNAHGVMRLKGGNACHVFDPVPGALNQFQL